MSKPAKRLIIGIVLSVLGGLIIPGVGFAVLFLPLLANMDSVRLIAPGQVEMQIEKPGKYGLWYDYRTTFDGRTYSAGRELPGGLEFELIRADDGTEVEFESGDNISSSSPETDSVIVGSYQVDRPGEYVLSVEGDMDQPRVFSFRRSVILKSLLSAIGIMILAGPLTLAGIGFAIAGIVGLSKSKGQ